MAIRQDAQEAYALSVRLFRATASVGSLAYLLDRGMKLLPEVEEGNIKSSILDFIADVVLDTGHLALKHQQYHTVQRYPWMEKFYAGNEVWPDFRTLGPIDLSLP